MKCSDLVRPDYRVCPRGMSWRRTISGLLKAIWRQFHFFKTHVVSPQHIKICEFHVKSSFLQTPLNPFEPILLLAFQNHADLFVAFFFKKPKRILLHLLLLVDMHNFSNYLVWRTLWVFNTDEIGLPAHHGCFECLKLKSQNKNIILPTENKCILQTK